MWGNILQADSRYDYIFCGIGVWTSLLLWEMFQNKLLTGKKICIIDPEKKNKNDKTFCFWASDDDPIIQRLSHIISKTWTSLEWKNGNIQMLETLKYRHIHSIDLYNSLKHLISSQWWERRFERVDDIWRDENGNYILVWTSKLRADIIFDNRTPSYKESIKPHIFQSFIGWMIESESPAFNADTFRFMDFEIPQQNSTQFIYVLPYSESRALIEVTRFGKEIISQTQADEILASYIQTHYGNYKKINTEIWCIPMSLHEIEKSFLPWVIHIGARNYNIKASSGYAFKNMFNEAQKISESIKNKEDIIQYNLSYENFISRRFAFYDWLLLDILERQPKYGKVIFTKLLKTTQIQKIFRFLDEATTLREELWIILKLPWKPFLQTLFTRIIYTSWFHPFILLVITSILWLSLNFSSFGLELGYILFFLWMLTIGIPHGAVDHILETGKWNVKKAPSFILSYLFLWVLIGVLWYFAAPIALIIFLLYSAWHFWQADGKKWDFSQLTIFLWGSSVLLYILATHTPETNSIIAYMGWYTLPFSLPAWSLIPWMFYALYRKNIWLLITLSWLTLSSQIPLLFAFGLYFIGQHSYTAWRHLQAHLWLDSQKIWIQSVPFHLSAWILLIIFYLLWEQDWGGQEFEKWGIFFIFLACLSFPHVISMHIMYRRNTL